MNTQTEAPMAPQRSARRDKFAPREYFFGRGSDARIGFEENCRVFLSAIENLGGGAGARLCLFLPGVRRSELHDRRLRPCLPGEREALENVLGGRTNKVVVEQGKVWRLDRLPGIGYSWTHAPEYADKLDSLIRLWKAALQACLGYHLVRSAAARACIDLPVEEQLEALSLRS